jgi:hypothetical protein
MNQYIHIGVEIAAISAITMKFNKKITELETRIEALENKKTLTARQPSVQIFETPQTKPDATEFIMSFFPFFNRDVEIFDSDLPPATIEEIDENDEKKLKSVFIKHLKFLADQDAEIPT